MKELLLGILLILSGGALLLSKTEDKKTFTPPPPSKASPQTPKAQAKKSPEKKSYASISLRNKTSALDNNADSSFDDVFETVSRLSKEWERIADNHYINHLDLDEDTIKELERISADYAADLSLELENSRKGDDLDIYIEYFRESEEIYQERVRNLLGEEAFLSISAQLKKYNDWIATAHPELEGFRLNAHF